MAYQMTKRNTISLLLCNNVVANQRYEFQGRGNIKLLSMNFCKVSILLHTSTVTAVKTVRWCGCYGAAGFAWDVHTSCWSTWDTLLPQLCYSFLPMSLGSFHTCWRPGWSSCAWPLPGLVSAAGGICRVSQQILLSVSLSLFNLPFKQTKF